MKRENWQKVKQIFNDALEIAPPEREAFLDKICAEDNSLRRDVEVLLKSFEEDFLEKPAVGQVAETIIGEQVTFKSDDRVGDYKIVTTLCPGGKERMRRLMDIVKNKRVDLSPLITHRFPLEEISEAYRIFGERLDGVMKIAVTP